MLYAWTILTTIGYGHLYPHTDAGRIATMIYALVGIPLALAILNDLGKLLTRLMKFPWFLAKRGSRRLFQVRKDKSDRTIRSDITSYSSIARGPLENKLPRRI